MTAKITTLSPAGQPERQPSVYLAPRVSKIVRVEETRVWVAVPDDEEPVVARVALPLARARLERACASRQDVLLTFEEGNPRLPIILGLLEQGAVDEPTKSEALADLTIEADADGKRVRVSARERIEFTCGAASVTLTRSGRIVVRGTHVETHASETNRIKGGRVRIN